MALRKGMRVRELTKRTGSPGRTGVILEIREGRTVDVRWDDGHRSSLRGAYLVPEKKKQPKT